MAKNPYNWGYRQAAKDAADMGFATGGKVGCYAEGGKVKKAPVVKNPSMLGPKKELQAIADIERAKASEKAYGFEGKTVGEIISEKARRDRRVRELKKQVDSGYAKGGAVKHSDVKQDKAMVKSMVKPSALKKADGGAVKKNWIASATKNKGGLHKSLGIAQGKKIPAKTLAKAATKGGKVGKQARLAQTLKSFKK